ncbi:purine and uridine phosphorylase [Astrocystis sublimbata]|nr:purine and uridine phosphorylase [Astrocystis sublimbata]
MFNLSKTGLAIAPPSITINNHGVGPQNIATGDGPQTNMNSAGTQNNYFGCTVVQKPPQSRETKARETEIPPLNDTRPCRREEFEIGIICALPLEYDAIALQFDEFYDEDGDVYGQAPSDRNVYTTGRIGKFNVAMVLLPGMGKVAAAASAANFRMSYPELRLTLVVGICGGVPGTGADAILMGDVVISKTIVPYPYDLLRPGDPTTGAGANYSRPNREIRTLLASFQTNVGRERLQKQTSEYLKDLQGAAAPKRETTEYQYPGVAEDKLFEASYHHKHRAPEECALCDGNEHCAVAALASCADLKCDESHLVHREQLQIKQGMAPDAVQFPRIFVGSIASGDTVMKSGAHRDDFAKREDVIAFEMEGVGVWNQLDCIIIKGICDYADSHKNKKWQSFAAATAACVMKAVLGKYSPSDRSIR